MSGVERTIEAGPSKVRDVVLGASGGRSVVRIEEDGESGPSKPSRRAARLPGLHWRNTGSVRRLAFVAKRR